MAAPEIDELIDVVGDTFDSSTEKWVHAIEAKDGNLYCPPWNASQVLRIEPGDPPITEAIGPQFAISGIKWACGVLALDGCIYSPPCDAESVLYINPAGEGGLGPQVSLLHISGAEEVGCGSTKKCWGQALVAPDGCVYCPPWCASRVLRVKVGKIPRAELVGPELLGPVLPAKPVRRIEGLTGLSGVDVPTERWGHGVVAGDGCIYCPPLGERHVLRIIPGRVPEVQLIGPDFGPNPYKWEHTVLADDGCLYCPPQCASQVLRIWPGDMTPQPSAELVGQELGIESDKWGHAVLGTDGAIYCAPCHATRVLRIDPSVVNEPLVELVGPGFGCMRNKWGVGLLAPDGAIYWPMWRALRVLRIRTQSSATPEVELVGREFPGGVVNWGCGVLAQDGCIYCPPWRGDRVLRIKPGEDHVSLSISGRVIGSSMALAPVLLLEGVDNSGPAVCTCIEGKKGPLGCTSFRSWSLWCTPPSRHCARCM